MSMGYVGEWTETAEIPRSIATPTRSEIRACDSNATRAYDSVLREFLGSSHGRGKLEPCYRRWGTGLPRRSNLGCNHVFTGPRAKIFTHVIPFHIQMLPGLNKGKIHKYGSQITESFRGFGDRDVEESC